MKGHGEKLSRKQELAIASLLTQPTIGAAAQKVGVAEVTLWRWLKQKDFIVAYRLARRQAVEGAIAQVQAASSQAVATLVDCLQGAENIRLRAAIARLDFAQKGVELLDLETRLAALEAAQSPASRNGRRL
jgi:hypothetical protein